MKITYLKEEKSRILKMRSVIYTLHLWEWHRELSQVGITKDHFFLFKKCLYSPSYRRLSLMVYFLSFGSLLNRSFGPTARSWTVTPLSTRRVSMSCARRVRFKVKCLILWPQRQREPCRAHHCLFVCSFRCNQPNSQPFFKFYNLLTATSLPYLSLSSCFLLVSPPCFVCALFTHLIYIYIYIYIFYLLL